MFIPRKSAFGLISYLFLLAQSAHAGPLCALAPPGPLTCSVTLCMLTGRGVSLSSGKKAMLYELTLSSIIEVR